MGNPTALERLDVIAAYLRNENHPLGEWLIEALALVRTGSSLEAALNLGHGYGAVVRAQTQAAALQRLAAAAPAQTDNGKARWINHQITAYAAAAWRRHRTTGKRPAGVEGSLFDMLASRAPTSARSIRRMLAKSHDDLANPPDR